MTSLSTIWIRGQVLAEDVVNPVTGEIITEADTKVDADLAVEIQDSAVPFVWIKGEERNIKVLSNRMVDLKKYVDCEPRELGIKELVYYPVLEKLMEEYTDAEELKEADSRGRTEGMKQGKREMIFAFLKAGVDIKTIKEASGLNEGEIELIRREMEQS